MPLPFAAFAAGAAAATGALVRGAQVGALDEGPEYIRDGNPASPIDAVGLFAARQACKVYANNPGAMNDRPAAAYERVCRPFLDNIGYGNGPIVKKPFEGGQCPDTRYLYTWDRFQAGVFIGSSQFDSMGPLSVVTRGFNGPGDPNCPAGQTFSQIIMVTGSGEVSLNSGCDVSISNLQVSPLFGGRDDCGNPSPDYEEPVPPDEPETGPRPFIFAPDFNFDVDVNLDVDGRISIDIGTGPIVVDPFAEPGNGGSGGGGYDGPPPPFSDPGPERPGGNGGFGGDDGFGDPPVGKRWTGACLTITVRPEGSGVIPGSVPEDVYPSVVGNVRLVGNAGGLRIVDTPVRILAKGVCCWEPFRGFNPVALNVDLLPGYGYTYRPYAVDDEG